jgi:hypothetical protein
VAAAREAARIALEAPMIHRPLLLLVTLLLPAAWAGDATDPAPVAPPTAAPAVAPAVKVAFGLITLASDRRSFTIAEAKGGTATLALDARTAITRDQQPVALTGLALDQQVRVTYQAGIALTIDQLSPDKKKKKKKPV